MKASLSYPRSPRRYGERPIRLLDTGTKKCLPHRCYKHPVRALNTAAALMNWQGVGTIEVYNWQSGRLLGTFRVHANGDRHVWIDSTIRGTA